MEVLLYLLFGFFDIFTILTFTFCMFRFPAKDYVKEFVIIAIVASAVSCVNRLVLDISMFDPGLQFIVLSLFFRYMLSFRLYEATLVTAVGYLGYTGVQFVLIPLLFFMGITELSDMTGLHEMGTYLIQTASDLAILLISWTVRRLGFGFSFVPQPPHSFTIKQRSNKLKKRISIAVSFGVFFILIVIYLLALAEQKTVYLLLLAFLPLSILLWLLRKRDKYD
ncbi:hypothetical protein [Brevibacillus brevis]|uniref:hypothetical protein n=1 Tax=Brevibacillus brevis TaxID=1393 RepID=UPI00165D415C|nr:hypothetical protein [Brevibacillus brevis]